MTAVDSAPIAIRLLGQPQFFVHGKPFRLAVSRRALSLLCYLLVKRHAPVSRSAAMLAVWPDEDDETARTALRRELHRLSKALPQSIEPWIVASTADLRWNDGVGAWLDLDAFADAVTADDLSLAIEVYRGDLLDGIDDDWIFAERERLRVANASALNKLLAVARSRHEYERAIDYAGRILTEDPFREDVLRTLVSLRFESGDRAGALHEAERYAKLYREELGVGLMPETEALRFAISRGEATVSADGIVEPPNVRPDRARDFTTEFLGRAHEFDRGIGLWHRAMRGVGSTVFISGEAGIGKSRFIQELALVAERQGGRVLVGHTSSPERLPYEAIASALGNAVPLLESVRAEPAMRRSMERMISGLARIESGEPVSAPATTVEREQSRLFASLTHYVSALARTRPLLLVLEDLHWARPSTVATLGSLAELATRSRLLVVASLRTESLGDVLAAERRSLISRSLATALPLGRLDATDAAAVVRSTNRATSLDEREIEDVVRFSEGNPLYLVERVAGYDAGGSPETRDENELARLINARVSRLSENVVDIASVAANIGERFALDVLGAICGLDEASLVDGIGQLIEQHLLVETTGRSSFDYAFTHHLIQRAIYDRIPPEKRRRRHRLIARRLEKRPDRRAGDAIDVARHFDAAGASVEAARAYRVASAFAIQSYANDEAAELLDRALALDPSPSGRFETLCAGHALQARLGNEARESRDLDTMEDLARSLGDGARLRSLQFRLARALRKDDVARADRLIAAIAEHPYANAGDRLTLAIARTRVAVVRGATADAIAQARVGLALVDESTPACDTAELLCRLAFALLGATAPEEVRERKASLDRALQLCSADDGNAGLLAHTTLAAAWNAYTVNEFSEADRYATASLSAANVVGDRSAIAEAFLVRLAVRRALRRLVDARADADAALDVARTLSASRLVARIRLNAAMIDADCGEIARAMEIYESILAEDTSMIERTLLASTHNSIAHCRDLLGDSEGALDSARRAREMFAAVGNHTHEGYALANLGAAERKLGDVRTAIATLDRALGILSSSFSFEDLASIHAERALGLAEIGDIERARARALEVLACDLESGGLSWQHDTYATVAKTMQLCGEEAQAQVALARASAAFDRHYEMVPDESRERFIALPGNRDLRIRLSAAMEANRLGVS